MKKRNLKSLKLNKKSISKLEVTDQVKGGWTGFPFGCNSVNPLTCLSIFCPS